MTITQHISIDLQQPGNAPIIHAVQGDEYTRAVEIDLYSGGVAWNPPGGCAVTIRYGKPDGKIGVYDTLPDGETAWAVNGNIITIILAPQMLTSAGVVNAQVQLINAKQIISTFHFGISVDEDPSKGAISSEDYIPNGNSISAAQLATRLPQPDGDVQVGDYLQVAEVDALGRVVRLVCTDAPSGGTATIPTYWQQALENGAQAINTALCAAGANKSAFLFYSDVHWNYGAQMAPTLLKYLHKHTGMTKTFFGGDIVNDEAADYDSMQYLWDWRRQLKDLPNHHSVVGNHDDGNSTNNLFSQEYVYGYLLAAEETPDMVRGDGLYYYVDNHAERTRYLCLDTGYKDLNSLSQKQSDFIKASLKSTPEGWHIVVVAHVWYGLDYDQYSQRPVPIKGLSDTAASVIAILDNYNSRTGEFADCGGWVEFCIGGHIHYDYVGKTNGGIPIILCETDSKHTRGSYAYGTGTSNESAVSGIIANYNDNTVTVVRVGRGASFVVDMDNPTVENTYTIVTKLTNVQSSATVSQVTEGASFTTTLNVTSGEMTSVVVTMGGKDITSSVYASDTGVITIPAVTGNVVITAVAESNEPAYTNVLDTVGYQTGYRLNSSGKATERADRSITGFIKVSPVSRIYFKNIQTLTGDYGCHIALYTSNNEEAFITGKSYPISATSVNATWWDDGSLKSFKIDVACEYVRFCFVGIDENSIITVNEPIE